MAIRDPAANAMRGQLRRSGSASAGAGPQIVGDSLAIFGNPMTKRDSAEPHDRERQAMAAKAVLGLTILAALFLIGAGWSVAGWQGSLSGFVCSVLIGSGLLIALGEGEAEGWRLAVRRIGGILGSILAGWCAYYGGWTWGWAWSLAGYAALLLTLMLTGIVYRLVSASN